MIFRIAVIFIVVFFALLLGLNENTNILGLRTFIIYPIVSLIIAGLFVSLEIRAHQSRGRKIFFASIGLILGVIIGWFFGEIFVQLTTNYSKNSKGTPLFSPSFKYIFMFTLSYVGFTLGWLKEEEFRSNIPAASGSQNKERMKTKILDTSVIIDGRIADIAETGFLEGEFVVPKFVLNELHQVADSSDPLKRSRGRRGLDILNNMKASKKAIIKITEEDFPDTPEVDSKLLKLALQYGNATIVTNDFNLNKVAEFQGVSILNINELANAVKPVLLPNEEIRITVIKEGKDQNQGIAYLDDGTMIVIDNGRHYIGREIDVVVTSILQTPAGRMIFTQINDGKR